MTDQLNIDAGKDKLIDILQREGRWDEFLKYKRRGQMKKMQDLVEEVITRRRKEFDEVMQK